MNSSSRQLRPWKLSGSVVAPFYKLACSHRQLVRSVHAPLLEYLYRFSSLAVVAKVGFVGYLKVLIWRGTTCGGQATHGSPDQRIGELGTPQCTWISSLVRVLSYEGSQYCDRVVTVVVLFLTMLFVEPGEKCPSCRRGSQCLLGRHCIVGIC